MYFEFFFQIKYPNIFFVAPRIRKPSRNYTSSQVEEPIKMPDFDYKPKPYDVKSCANLCNVESIVKEFYKFETPPFSRFFRTCITTKSNGLKRIT